MNNAHSINATPPASRKIHAYLCAALLSGVCGADALAQDVSLTPTYGSVTLASGFSPDPHVVEITAGGSRTASETDSDCSGFVANSPDFQIRYEQEDYALSIFAVADSDVTLMVNAPDGSWHCNDDSNHLDGTDPGVHFEEPLEGRYDIWVGAYSTDTNYISAKLLISETAEEDWRSLVAELDTSSATDPEPDVSLPPTYGATTLASGFNPDPHVVEIVAGGSVTASETDSSCSGYIADSADFELTYESDQYALSILALADSDVTLMVNAPDGTWHCNDDSSYLDGTNPGVHFGAPLEGRYDIWVGAYSADTNYVSAKLLISEAAEEDWRTLVTNLDKPTPAKPDPKRPAGNGGYGKKEI